MIDPKMVHNVLLFFMCSTLSSPLTAIGYGVLSLLVDPGQSRSLTILVAVDILLFVIYVLVWFVKYMDKKFDKL